MSSLVPLLVVLPLLGAALTTVASRIRWIQRSVTLSVLVTTTAIAVALLVHVDQEQMVVHHSGGWPAPLGVVLVVDRLAALMASVSAVVLLAVVVYAIGERGEEARRDAFHPAYLVLAAGVFGSFITGDLFNLFVSFEMMLVASYVLIMLGGRHDQVRSGISYVVISLVASALFITLLALLYSATGTVNMADLTRRVGTLDSGIESSFALGLLVVFGIKAGLFPLFFWLPDSYPTAPGPITAVFAGLLTKVGVYAIIRTQTLVFGAPDWMGTVLLWVGVATMVVGVFGAIAQDDMKRILAFHIISQIGYMIFGLGLFTTAGLAGAVFYVAHHIVVKTTLFLVAGLVARRAGSSRLSEVGGLVRASPILALLFAVPALSLAGIPPFSGFVAKLALVDAGLADHQWWVAGFALFVGLLTMFSMLKIWAGVFWGEPEHEPSGTPTAHGRRAGPALMVLPTALLGAVSIAVAMGAGPLYRYAERAAADLLDPNGYVETVLAALP